MLRKLKFLEEVPGLLPAVALAQAVVPNLGWDRRSVDEPGPLQGLDLLLPQLMFLCRLKQSVPVGSGSSVVDFSLRPLFYEMLGKSFKLFPIHAHFLKLSQGALLPLLSQKRGYRCLEIDPF